MLQKFIIKGGKKLSGEIDVGGSKNASLPIMVAAILADTPSIIRNVPILEDTKFMVTILEHLGAKVNFDKENRIMTIDPSTINIYEAPYDLVRKMRASIYVLGPLLAKYGTAKVSLPGGCNFGPRPIDLHLKGMELLGGKYTLDHGYINMKAKKLKGTEIYLDKVSVGATANIMMAAVLANGRTKIVNVAKEPEIINLGEFLIKMGAEISGLGSNEIIIDGVKKLNGCDFTIIPDRIEAGTYAILGALICSKLKIKNVISNHLTAVIDKLHEMNVDLKVEDNYIEVKGMKKYKAAKIITEPFPGIPTDLQAQFIVLMTQAYGVSIVQETIYPDRFLHVSELNRLGSNIILERDTAIINGKTKLVGAEIMASDLRAGAALLLAGLIAEDETVINRIYHIDRGYERIEEKLNKIGAEIKRINV